MTYRRWLLGLLVFNALTAIAGGIGLLGGAVAPPTTLLEHTPFDDFTVPGLTLLGVVGGSSLFAAIAVWRNHPSSRMMALVAGVIMVGWIVAEVLLIRTIDPLQGLYLVTGTATIVLSFRQRL